MNLTYPSSNSIDLMSEVLSGLSGAALFMTNAEGGGPVIASSVAANLSSSPGFILPDGTIIVKGSSVEYYYDGSVGTVSGGFLSLGNLTGIPIVTGPVAVLATSSDKYVYFLGAVIPPPAGGKTIPSY